MPNKGYKDLNAKYIDSVQLDGTLSNGQTWVYSSAQDKLIPADVTGSDTYQVKASATDASPDFLDGKVDDTTIEVLSDTLQLKDGGITNDKINATAEIAWTKIDTTGAVASDVGAMENPMTTAGDIIVGDTGGTPIRLGVGTEGQILSISSGEPTWINGGGSGTVTSVSAGNGMDFTTITGTGSVTLGTPGTVTGSTTNTVTANSHTHALSVSAGDVSGLATVATTGSYDDLSDTPTLATVATTGAYSDLTGAPTIVNDKNYEQAFINASSIVVAHNLNKYPSVLILDTAGYEIIGGIQHTSKNSCTVTLTSVESGTVICN